MFGLRKKPTPTPQTGWFWLHDPERLQEGLDCRGVTAYDVIAITPEKANAYRVWFVKR